MHVSYARCNKCSSQDLQLCKCSPTMLPSTLLNVPFKWRCGSKAKRHHHKIKWQHCTAEWTQIRVMQFAPNETNCSSMRLHMCNRMTVCEMLFEKLESGVRNGFWLVFWSQQGKKEVKVWHFNPDETENMTLEGMEEEILPFDQQQQQGMRPASWREGLRERAEELLLERISSEHFIWLSYYHTSPNLVPSYPAEKRGESLEELITHGVLCVVLCVVLIIELS